MNKKILQKVVDELGKETPDLSYIRGILETLMETFEIPVVTPTYFPPIPYPNPLIPPYFISDGSTGVVNTDDPGAILDAEARAKIAKVKEMAEKSMEN